MFLPVGLDPSFYSPVETANIDLSDPAYWPNDSYGSRWNYWSWIHPDAYDAVAAYSPYELELGSGLTIRH